MNYSNSIGFLSRSLRCEERSCAMALNTLLAVCAKPLAVWAFALLSMLLIPQGAVQAEVVGRVGFVSGLVTASGSGKSARELSKDHTIENGQRIDTAVDGRIQMRFTDGGLVSLMPESTFSVDEYLYTDSTQDKGTLVFSMLRGGLRTITGTIGKTRHESYQLNTPVATLGIRGTEYIAVLNPPNTLRVHVGRGKVVLTNNHGTLEVPAGRNAVVILGKPPAFSEQDPLYLAARPERALLALSGAVQQDPFLTAPLQDLDTPDITVTSVYEIVRAPAASAAAPGADLPPPVDPGPLPSVVDPGPVPPVVDPGLVPPVVVPEVPPVAGPVLLQDGPGYAMAGVSTANVIDPPYPWSASQVPDGLTAAFDTATGALLSLDGTSSPVTVVTQGEFQVVNVETVDALSWGEFTDGNGFLDGVQESATSSQYLPYVVGLTPDAVPAGMLNYTLEGSTAVRDMHGNQGQLNRFDLGIDVGSPRSYTLDMELTMPSLNSSYSVNSAGTITGDQSGFTLQATPGSIFSGVVQCTACGLNVSGFLAGQNAEQAGVTYVLDDMGPENRFYGAAGLVRPH